LDNYVAACQVGITISSLVLGAYGQNTIAPVLAPYLVGLGTLTEPASLSIAAIMALVFLSTLHVVFGELLPKSIAIQYPEKMALFTVIPMHWSMLLYQPLIWFFNGSSNLCLRIFRVDNTHGHSHLHSPEEIELLVGQSRKGGLLHEQEQQFLRNVFRWRNLVARQVMVPRTRIVAAPIDSQVKDLVEIVCQEGFSRIPLYNKGIDDIVGFVHVKDIFRLQIQGQQDVQSIVRKVTFVPESLAIADLWLRLTAQDQYLAIVIDEYSGVAGLITIEDLIEEIFGELQDEFDEELPLISADNAGRLHLRGDLLVTDINEYLNLILPTDEADTLGGLVFSQLGQMPKVGTEVVIGSVTIRVETMTDLSISEVSLLLPGQTIPHIAEWEDSHSA
jgi:CBS domain containing-hemolysin-like protein